MKRVLFILLFGAGYEYSSPAIAQQAWPRPVSLADGAAIYINSLQPDSLSGDILAFRAAFMLVTRGGKDTLYGSFHALAVISVSRNDRTFAIRTANVLSMQLAEKVNPDTLDYWKDAMECGLPTAEKDVPVDELLACRTTAFDPQTQPRLGHTPPRIIFVEKPTALAQIDGIPQFRRHRQWNIGVLANSPNVIISGDNAWFYLYGGHHWYIAPMSEGPYHQTTEVTPAMRQVTLAVEADNKTGSGRTGFPQDPRGTVKDVVVSLVPAELIQTRGTPVYSAIKGTGLRYVTNTDNDIFLDTTGHRFFLLISGRWYSAERLVGGTWSYVAPDSLPAGFSRIPEGSPKDNVLASVSGTEAAREALLDAAIPQTARIRRNTTTGGAAYDLGPRFRPIDGTRLQYAINSTMPVFST
ncbi:MAG TPA: hypothetical protein VN616_12415, partial [Puia sp.]|nr:hypothetical protein [Puia sp.]